MRIENSNRKRWSIGGFIVIPVWDFQARFWIIFDDGTHRKYTLLHIYISVFFSCGPKQSITKYKFVFTEDRWKWEGAGGQRQKGRELESKKIYTYIHSLSLSLTMVKTFYFFFFQEKRKLTKPTQRTHKHMRALDWNGNSAVHVYIP